MASKLSEYLSKRRACFKVYASQEWNMVFKMIPECWLIDEEGKHGFLRPMK